MGGLDTGRAARTGGRADVGIPFNGSAHSLSALHVRNDAINGTYLAFDQHFVAPGIAFAFSSSS